MFVCWYTSNLVYYYNYIKMMEMKYKIQIRLDNVSLRRIFPAQLDLEFSIGLGKMRNL